MKSQHHNDTDAMNRTAARLRPRTATATVPAAAPASRPLQTQLLEGDFPAIRHCAGFARESLNDFARRAIVAECRRLLGQRAARGLEIPQYLHEWLARNQV